jgi:hypothetical protein
VDASNLVQTEDQNLVTKTENLTVNETPMPDIANLESLEELMPAMQQ